MKVDDPLPIEKKFGSQAPANLATVKVMRGLDGMHHNKKLTIWNSLSINKATLCQA